MSEANVHSKNTFWRNEPTDGTAAISKPLQVVVSYIELAKNTGKNGLENLFQNDIARNHWNLRLNIRLSPPDD